MLRKLLRIIYNYKFLAAAVIISVAAGGILAGSREAAVEPVKSLKFTSKEEKMAYIAIVIDDFGNRGNGTEQILSLDIPITAAVMPFLPFTEEDAKAAHDSGKDVILHIPMEPVKGKASWLGPGAVKTGMHDNEIEENVRAGLDQLKWAVGMNNHMGSRITQDKHIMKLILRIAKERNIFYIDSATTAKSVALNVASTMEVPCFSRDVFLDNSKKQIDIEKQLDCLTKVALKKGYAIGIGHVGPEGGIVTYNAIKNKYKTMEEQGIRFVSVTQLLEILRSSNTNKD